MATTVRINYSLRNMKFNAIQYRLFTPTGDDTVADYVELDTDTLVQSGTDVFAQVSSSGGEPATVMAAAGGDKAQEGDEYPELNLKFMSGAWYQRIGAAV